LGLLPEPSLPLVKVSQATIVLPVAVRSVATDRRQSNRAPILPDERPGVARLLPWGVAHGPYPGAVAAHVRTSQLAPPERSKTRPSRGEERVSTVGVVGVGAMGTVMVERFLAVGLRTVVYDVSAPALERAVALGAEPRSSPAHVGQVADVVDVMVRTDDEM